MNRIICLLIISIMFNINAFAEDNPLLKAYSTPYNIPPFEKIKPEHYVPAFKEAIKQQEEAVRRITESKETPDFFNTIEALENSDILLSEVGGVFYNMRSANTNDAIQAAAKEIAPMISKHNDNILLNNALFEKVK